MIKTGIILSCLAAILMAGCARNHSTKHSSQNSSYALDVFPKMQSFAISPIKHLPFLRIQLGNPVYGTYQYAGAKSSMISYEEIIVKNFGLGGRWFSNVGSKDMGSCITFSKGRARYCITYVNSLYDANQQYLSGAHEEMHVIQNLQIQEAYKILNFRFKRVGYPINLRILSREDQAYAVMILVATEKGFKINTLLPNHPQIKNVERILLQQKKTQQPLSLFLG